MGVIDATKEMIIIHTIPIMADTERERIKKRIGNELYEVFTRILQKINIDNELS